MINRLLHEVAFDGEWGRQMRFICGPRQAGKTTLAKHKLQSEQCQALYYLWDLRAVRQLHRQDELFFTANSPPSKRHPWVCFDEIHKMPKWKNILKAAFDSTGHRFRFIVTGSAKLDILRHAGDSLAGRYFTFHLFPLVLGETSSGPISPFAFRPPDTAQALLEQAMDVRPSSPADFDNLLRWSGFPEPFLRASQTFHRKWSSEYADNVIREDIGSLTRIIDRENIHELFSLLPEMIGSPLSMASLAAHIQISPITVRNYLRRIEDFYLGFSLCPYHRNVKRSLLKARKMYLYDWSRISDPARSFENYVACELKTRITLWNDSSGVAFGLSYVRTKDGLETDFLLTRDSRPWMLVEAKLSDGQLERHHARNAYELGRIPVIRVCREDRVARIEAPNAIRISASRMFA